MVPTGAVNPLHQGDGQNVPARYLLDLSELKEELCQKPTKNSFDDTLRRSSIVRISQLVTRASQKITGSPQRGDPPQPASTLWLVRATGSALRAIN